MINLRRFKLLSILKPNNFYFVPTFQFARKNKPTPPTDNDKTESTTTDPQTIRVISEDVPLRIAPYFDTGIEKDKVVFKLEEKNKEEVPQGQGERKKSKKKLKKEEEMRGQQQERVKKRKLNITLENIKRELPKDIYRMGLTSEDMVGHHELVQRAFSLDNSSVEEFKKARMLEIRKIFGKHERDTASPPVTACALCEQVLALLTHIKKFPKDMTALIKLQTFLTKRRKYLLYLKRTDFNSYSYVIKYYGLKDFDDSMHKLHLTGKYLNKIYKKPSYRGHNTFPLLMNKK